MAYGAARSRATSGTLIAHSVSFRTLAANKASSPDRIEELLTVPAAAEVVGRDVRQRCEILVCVQIPAAVCINRFEDARQLCLARRSTPCWEELKHYAGKVLYVRDAACIGLLEVLVIIGKVFEGLLAQRSLN